MVDALTTYPTHPKFGTAITNNLNQRTIPQVRRPVIVVAIFVTTVMTVLAGHSLALRFNPVNAVVFHFMRRLL